MESKDNPSNNSPQNGATSTDAQTDIQTDIQRDTQTHAETIDPSLPSSDPSQTEGELDSRIDSVFDFKDDSTPLQSKPALVDLLKSRDLPSKTLTGFAIFFAILSTLCIAFALTLYFKKRAAIKEAEELAQLQKQEKKAEPTFSESVGHFQLFIQSEQQRIEFVAEMDLTAECGQEAVCIELKNRLAEARDLILPILSQSSQEDYQNSETKKLIREKLTDRLNSMGLSGKILAVHFTALTFERRKKM